MDAGEQVGGAVGDVECGVVAGGVVGDGEIEGARGLGEAVGAGESGEVVGEFEGVVGDESGVVGVDEVEVFFFEAEGGGGFAGDDFVALADGVGEVSDVVGGGGSCGGEVAIGERRHGGGALGGDDDVDAAVAQEVDDGAAEGVVVVGGVEVDEVGDFVDGFFHGADTAEVAAEFANVVTEVEGGQGASAVELGGEFEEATEGAAAHDGVGYGCEGSAESAHEFAAGEDVLRAGEAIAADVFGAGF